jgi:hypothetical protein
MELHNWLKIVIKSSRGILSFVNLTADFAVDHMCGSRLWYVNSV